MKTKKKKRSSLKFGPLLCPKSGTEKGHERKKFSPKLDATTSTLPGPPRLGPGYDVPPELPSRKPCRYVTFYWWAYRHTKLRMKKPGKSAYFFIEKQKRKKSGQKRILCKSALSWVTPPSEYRFVKKLTRHLSLPHYSKINMNRLTNFAFFEGGNDYNLSQNFVATKSKEEMKNNYPRINKSKSFITLAVLRRSV